jgi:hypothetical protein
VGQAARLSLTFPNEPAATEVSVTGNSHHPLRAEGQYGDRRDTCPTRWAVRSLRRTDLKQSMQAIVARAHSISDFGFRFSDFGFRPRLLLALVMLTLAGTTSLHAYPEFQQYIVKHSGRPVNCALCHANADGPEGAGPGQIGHLNAAEQAELVRARGAFEPGTKPNSPILNAFGNHIINQLGKRKFLELRLAPAQLAEALPPDSDLDGDGIPDVKEFLAGTHPLLASDGNPWLLFRANFQRNFPQLALALAATVAGLWGLGHLLRGFAAATRVQEEEEV